jgi:ATP:ADP antiporter, AAA family
MRKSAEEAFGHHLLESIARIAPRERRAVALAAGCYFALLATFYILRPVRDTLATLFVQQLSWLFTGTFVGTLIASPLFAALAARMRLDRLIPGVFWFWLANVLVFVALFKIAPDSRVLAVGYYIWFSVVNLFMISVFWSLMVDTFSPSQATRLFALIAAGGEIGAIAGPLITRGAVGAVGVGGLLLFAAVGFIILIVLVHLLMREKAVLRASDEEAQRSTLDHRLAGNPFEGFAALFRSSYTANQAAFMLLMTYVNTVAYFFQTDVIAKSISAIEGRAVVIADMDLAVNVLSATILIFGLGRVIQRFGVTAALVLNPLLMLGAFAAMALSPTLLVIQVVQVVRRVAQYAIARPSREICFTVVEQTDRYKSKNVIDVVVYRFGDLSSAWVQTGLGAAGLRILGSSVVGFGVSVLWGVVAVALGRRYEVLRAEQARSPSPRAL